MIRFIDEHKDRRSGTLRWGIEPIATQLGIAPSTYYAAKSRPPSARAVRDAELRPIIARVHAENYVAYGADKMWDHLNNVEAMGLPRVGVTSELACPEGRPGRMFTCRSPTPRNSATTS